MYIHIHMDIDGVLSGRRVRRKPTAGIGEATGAGLGNSFYCCCFVMFSISL